MTDYLGSLLGFERARSIESIDVRFAADWASEYRWAVLGMCLAAIAAVVVFYRHFETRKSLSIQIMLTTIRSAIACLLIATLAAPLVHSSATVMQLPLVYLIIDDSESMSIADSDAEESSRISRIDQLRQLLSRQGDDAIGKLEEQAKCRTEVLKLSSEIASSPREEVTHRTLLARMNRDSIDSELGSGVSETPLLEALGKLPERTTTERIAAAIVFSDFADTSSLADRDKLIAGLAATGTAIHSVGVGVTDLLDVAVEIRSDDKVKLGEPTTISVDVRQSGLDQQAATVSLTSRPLQFDSADESAVARTIAEQTINLDQATATLEFSYTPIIAGNVELVANVTPFDGELLLENNAATRQLGVIEDHLRITYVDYEPNWEWRHIKEVFNRDKLVGREGFRTYLASAATSVRMKNDLFSKQLNVARSEFFANDVIVLGDGPRELFTPEFCEMTEEFVGRFGGGLVVVAGPRFGPGQLAETSIAKMLPVVLHDESRLDDAAEFVLEKTKPASLFPFMQLADSPAEDTAAWTNLGKLPWYQPVSGIHEQAEVLAMHSSDLCDDGQTRQPLIAIRSYGNGQVVYVGFNEMWRLRKRYGDRYYQRFWSQLIYRLGMSHAVGPQKRFVAAFDRAAYRVGERAIFSVEAYDDDYQPLGLTNLTNEAFAGEFVTTTEAGKATRQLSIPATRSGRFETAIPLTVAGRYSVRVIDPITDRIYERSCVVSESSVERQQIVRDSELQRRISKATGGKTYDISQVDQLISELTLEPSLEKQQRQLALWNTPAWFLLVVGLMLSEWTIRKLAFLR